MHAVRTINEPQARTARALVDHNANRDYSGICRCGNGYGFDATTNRPQRTEGLFRVTPKEVTRC
jgi:hypothetical protein